MVRRFDIPTGNSKHLRSPVTGAAQALPNIVTYSTMSRNRSGRIGQGELVHPGKASGKNGLGGMLNIRAEPPNRCRNARSLMRNRGWSGVGRGCRGAGDGGGGRALSGADGGAPLPGGAAEDRRNAVVRRALARPVGGADRLLGAGAEVRRPRAVPLPAPRRPLRGAQRIRHPRRSGTRRPRPARPRPAALRRRPRQRRRRHRHRRQDHAQRHLY